MYTETIRLNKSCEICGNISYAEDNSGFYVCQTCGTISDIRCGAELEFEAKSGFMKMKVKSGRKTSNDNIDEDFEVKSIDNDDSDKETNVYTSNNTRNNSEVNDFSNASSWGRRRRKSNKIIPTQKTVKESLLESQRIFFKIVKRVNSIGSEGSNSHDGDEGESRNPNSSVIKYAKTIWFNYINNEYDIQTKRETLFGKGRRTNMKYVRSRANTIEDINNCVPTQVKETLTDKGLSSTMKPKHLNEQLKSRRIKADNIMKLYDDKKHMVNKKKFIEEYDEVLKFLKSTEVKKALLEKNIEIKHNALFYSDLLKICSMLKIEYNQDKNDNYKDYPSFEELIHLIFIDQTMNYQTTQVCQYYDSKQTTLNGDYFLSLLYQIFNQSPSISSSETVILSKDLISLYKNFDFVHSLNQNELNMFKYSNYEKYNGLLNAFDHSDPWLLSRASRIIKAINSKVLHLPDTFPSICLTVLNKIESEISKIMGSSYLIEDICIAICFYVIKVVYGLNDLPYLALLQKHKNSFSQNAKIINAIASFEKNTSNDYLGRFYNELPSLLEIIESFSNELSKEDNSQIMTLNQSLKQNLTQEYKERYAKCNYEHLYNDIQNMFSAKNIKDLESKFDKYSRNNNKMTKETINKNVEIKKSNRFLLKQKKTTQVQKINAFLKEEIKYHRDNNSEDNVNTVDIEYPFPCDTYIHHNRQANKFDSFKLPTAEVTFLFFFSKYFKIDYNSLKVLIKAVERSADK